MMPICDTYPCPNCDNTILIKKSITEFTNGAKKNDNIHVEINECSICKTLITSIWEIKPKRNFKMISRYPIQTTKLKADKIFIDKFNKFIEIFNEASAAEAHDLKNICGVGYRKALEFLIKDYCSYKIPDEYDNIKFMPISECIKTYIKDEAIRNTATRAIWLGNDEAHYMKIWEDKDVRDLKDFINSIVIYVTTELKYKKMMVEMPKPLKHKDNI